MSCVQVVVEVVVELHIRAHNTPIIWFRSVNMCLSLVSNMENQRTLRISLVHPILPIDLSRPGRFLQLWHILEQLGQCAA